MLLQMGHAKANSTWMATAILALILAGFASAGHAVMITPAEATEAQAEISHLNNVQAFLAREDVRANLEALGVTPEEAEQRVAMLSPEELATLSGDIDDLPAGGVLEVLGVVLVVLIVLEILGVTNVFSNT